MTISYAGPGGARNNYGPREVARKEAGILAEGIRKTLVVPIAFDNLPSAANSGNDAVAQFIPAGCPVIRSFLKPITAFTGGTGTGLQIGLEQANGTDIDADGLFLDAQVVSANLVATNFIAGRGACNLEAPDAAATAHGDADGVYVRGATGPVPSVNAYPVVTAVTGPYTAGAAVLYIEYLDVR